MSNLLADDLKLSPLAPFLASLPVILLCAVIIMVRWEENYGDTGDSVSGSLLETLNIVISNKTVLRLGIIQTCAESAMYIFVFLWTPVLDTDDGVKMPLGWIFSTFMLAIMLGSQISSTLVNLTQQRILNLSLIIMTVSLFITAVFTNNNLIINSNINTVIIYISFLSFEAALGAYFPAIGSLRGEIVPEHCRANVMTWFRLPLNIITCLVLLSTNFTNISKSFMFIICSVLCSLGAWVSSKISRSHFIIHL